MAPNPNLPVIIIQARLASTRLPNKIILDYYHGEGILAILLKRIKSVIPKEQIIIATSEQNVGNQIQNIAAQHEVNIFSGSENNVLQRFIEAADYFKTKYIIRICSDNVFLDLKELERLFNITTDDSNPLDYCSFWVDNKPSITTHYGLWAEWVTTCALKQVSTLTNDPLYEEHVTNYIHSNPELFKLKWLNPKIIPSNKIRLTTDTPLDFEYQKEIYKQLYSRFGQNFSTQDILNFLEKNSNFVTLMEQEIKNNAK